MNSNNFINLNNNKFKNLIVETSLNIINNKGINN
jgi:hypothetical protein